MDNDLDHFRLLDQLAAAARGAGERAMRYFTPGAASSAAVTLKAGDSPVTEADFEADAFLEEALRALVPEAAYVSEEQTDDPAQRARRILFIVDPIDGTRAFMRGDLRWAVSIALAIDAKPVAAVLHLPALNRTFAAAEGYGATLNGKRITAARRTKLEGARTAGPGSMLGRLRASGLHLVEEKKIPSLAYRLAQVAAAELDLAMASTDSHDWDIAAADLILRESGAVLCGLTGRPPVYNGIQLRHDVLAAAHADLMPSALQALRAAEPAARPARDDRFQGRDPK